MTPLRLSGLTFLCALATGGSLHAAQIAKSITGTDLIAADSWTGGVAPGSGDVAYWDTKDNSLGGDTLTLSADTAWAGLYVKQASDGIDLGKNDPTARTLTILGGQTINGVANAGIVVGNNTALGIRYDVLLGSSQVWSVGAGGGGSNPRTLNLYGKISGDGYALSKIGAGTLILRKGNDYTGGTFVNEGRFIALGSPFVLRAPGDLTVASGGTFSLTNPGSGVNGVLRLASSNASIVNHGVFEASGTLDLGGVFDGASISSYTLISGTGTITGTFAGGITGFDTAKYESVSFSGGVLNFVAASAVPEPGTYGLLTAGALAWATYVRRRGVTKKQ